MLIAYRDAIENSTLQCSNITSATQENMKDRRLAVKALASTASASFIEASFDAEYEIGIISLLGHTIPSGANCEFTLSDYDGAGIYTETFTGLWAPPANSQFPRHTHFILSQIYTGVFGLTLSISGAAITTPIKIGRLWSSTVFQPEAKTAFGEFSVETLDDTVVNKSIGQQAYVDYRDRYRRLNCSIPYLTQAEAIGTENGLTQNMQDIGFEVGRGGSIIVIPSQESDQLIHKFGVYGHFAEAPTIRLKDRNEGIGRMFDTSFNVIEDL